MNSALGIDLDDDHQRHAARVGVDDELKGRRLRLALVRAAHSQGDSEEQ
jgi:hypothetical protein